jgi:hypothetical protein
VSVKGLELEREPLQGLLPREHALFEAIPNHMLRIDESMP